MKYVRIILKATQGPIFSTLFKLGNWPLDLQPSINGSRVLASHYGRLRQFDARISEFSKLCFRVEQAIALRFATKGTFLIAKVR